MQCNEISFYFGFCLKFWKMLTFKMFVIIKEASTDYRIFFYFPSLNESSWSGIYLNHPSHSGLFLLCITMIFLCDDRGNPKSKETQCSIPLCLWHSQKSSLIDVYDSPCLGNVTFSWWQNPFWIRWYLECRDYGIYHSKLPNQYFYFVLWYFPSKRY